MRKGKQYLLSSKDPDMYIERCLQSSLTQGEKAQTTHLWLQKTGYTIADINYARNRNSYWKEKKLRGNNERTLERIRSYNYSKGSKTGWDDELIKSFLTRNKRGKDGQYTAPDYELARFFQTTIPAIQYMRRKFILSEKIRQIDPSRSMLAIMRKSEQKIQQLLNSLQ